MDIELERWKAAGKYFDYLGFNIFYRTEGSGPTLQYVGLGAAMGQADRPVHRGRARHARHGILRQARRLRLLGA